MQFFRTPIALALAVLTLCIPTKGQAETFNAGFQTIGFAEQSTGFRLDINVWYPCRRAQKTLRYPPWKLSGALAAQPAEGTFPVILLSHPSAGTRFTHHNTAQSLAQNGFVVAAPTHPSDNMDNMPALFTWEQALSRIRELQATLGILKAQEDLAPILDLNRVGVLGFGAGATAALLLGGALPDCKGWEHYCDGKKSTESYCQRWAKERITASLCKALPPAKSLADTRITAVAAIAPDFSMLFGEGTFRYFYPPLFVGVAGKDQVNLPSDVKRLAKASGRAYVVELDYTDQSGLMAPCPDTLMDELPELCRSVTEEERLQAHFRLRGELAEFFLRTLVTDPRPNIPAPPDLTPKPEPKKASDKKERSQRRERRVRPSSSPRQLQPLVRPQPSPLPQPQRPGPSATQRSVTQPAR